MTEREKKEKQERDPRNSLEQNYCHFIVECTEILEDTLLSFPQFDLFNLCEIESYK